MRGAELEGVAYDRLFDYYADVEHYGLQNAWQILVADYVTTEDGRPVVSFAYASRALAEAAATHLESALLNAMSVHAYAD